jgi:hypothetical protein
MRLTTIISASALALLALYTGGCATYKPGTGAPTASRTIWVAPAVNQSYMPQIAVVITERVREAFLTDDETMIARRDEADTRLDITVTGVDRFGRASGLNVTTVDEKTGERQNKVDRGLDKAYDVVITARAVLTETKTGKVLLDREYAASSQALPSPYNLTNADNERMLLPILARDIARQVHDAIAHGWAAPAADHE